MDIKELLKKGLYQNLSFNDLWELEQDAGDLEIYAGQDAALAVALGNFRNYVAQRNFELRSPEMQTVIVQNLQLLNNLEQNINIFARNEQGDYLYREVAPLAGFFKRLTVVNEQPDDKIETADIKDIALRLGRLGAVEEITLDDKFAKLSPAAQEHRYVNAVIEAAETYAFNLVGSQISEDIVKTSAGRMTELNKSAQKQLQNLAEQRFSAMIDNDNKETFKVTNGNVVSTAAVEIARLEKSSSKISAKSENREISLQVAVADRHIRQAAPQTYPLAKDLAMVAEISFLADKNVYNAYRVNNAVRQAVKSKPADAKTPFVFFREHRRQLVEFSTAVVKTIKNAVQTINIVSAFKAVTSKIAANLEAVLPQMRTASAAEVTTEKPDETRLLSPIQINALRHDLENIRIKARQAVSQHAETSRAALQKPAWQKFRESLANSRFYKQDMTAPQPRLNNLDNAGQGQSEPSFRSNLKPEEVSKLAERQTVSPHKSAAPTETPAISAAENDAVVDTVVPTKQKPRKIVRRILSPFIRRAVQQSRAKS